VNTGKLITFHVDCTLRLNSYHRITTHVTQIRINLHY